VEADEALDRDGATRFYELGHDAEPGDDAKLRNVAFFKSGLRRPARAGGDGG
jgi:hypothetical protein